MGKFLEELSEDLQAWAQAQPVFFVASAPTKGKHVNVSPKGLAGSTLTVFDSRRAAYVDFPGSGSETVAHLYDNGRVTLMFCSFEVRPRTMRLFCWGRVVEADGGARWRTAKAQIEATGRKVADGARAIIMLEVWKVGLSCGFGVPLLRNTVDAAAAKKNPRKGEEVKEEEQEEKSERTADMATYCKDGFVDRPTIANMLVKLVKSGKMDGFLAKYNTRSLDGMPCLRSARKTAGQWMLVEDARAWFQSRVAHPEALVVGILLGLLVAVFISLLKDIRTDRGMITLDVGGFPGGLSWRFGR